MFAFPETLMPETLRWFCQFTKWRPTMNHLLAGPQIPPVSIRIHAHARQPMDVAGPPESSFHSLHH